jgi:hypothetical protein
MVAQEAVPFGVHFQDAGNFTTLDRSRRRGRCWALIAIAIVITAWRPRASAMLAAASAASMMLRSVAA